MKHAWILNHYAQVPGAPGGTRHYSLAKHLPAHGWRATIVASNIEHQTGRDRLPSGQDRKLEVHDGVSFLWLRTAPYSGNGVQRVNNMVSYFRQVLRKSATAALDRPDLIMGSTVHPLAALGGYILARRHRVPFVFEVRDLWPQTLIDMGRIRANSPQARLMRTLELFLYRRACRIVTLMPRAADYIVPLGVAAHKIVWISNGADLASSPANPVADPRDGNFTLMYAGAFGDANSLETLLHAMQHVESDPAGRTIRLRLIGEGPRKEFLRLMAAELGLKAVSFEPAVAKEHVPELLAEADGFVVCLRNLPGLYRYGISLNKLFDYLAAERPIIIATAASNDPVAEAGAGYSVPPEEPKLLAAAVLKLASLPVAERRRMGEAGRLYVGQHYAYSALAGRLADVFNQCCEGRS